MDGLGGQTTSTCTHIYAHAKTTKQKAQSRLLSPLMLWKPSGEAPVLSIRRSTAQRGKAMFDGCYRNAVKAVLFACTHSSVTFPSTASV